MNAKYQPVIGLEIHAVLETQSKMFCDCPVVDSTHDEPNSAVCPVCAGMPGMLPVLNKAAVEYALKVALALNCEIQHSSIFARKSYFYPDLPKGFQISQYEEPLATNGWLLIDTAEGEQRVGIRRVHLEEDTGKLTHVYDENGHYSLVDLNRSGVPLLEIVTEPQLHSVEAVRNCAYAIRGILRYLGVNSGDLEKGLLRIEPNISLRVAGSQDLNTRVEIKNLNSFRSLERAVEYELTRQEAMLASGESILQQTLGWDDGRGTTQAQRSKEFAEDYRYFPEPDLPPLVVDEAWVDELRAAIPELPQAKRQRFVQDYALSDYDAGVLSAEREVADFFEAAAEASQEAEAKTVANWISSQLFGLMNAADSQISELKFEAGQLAALLDMLTEGRINAPSARQVLEDLFEKGGDAADIVKARGLAQISDKDAISAQVAEVLDTNSEQLAEYLKGKENLENWFFGQAMGASGGQANPQVLRSELQRQLAERKNAIEQESN